MTDSMKFGPEWLRNLSGESCSTGGGGGGTTSLTTPRYQLAEHRYGREEMLALFDRTYKPPEPLTTFSALYVEKTQLPLALIQMTEDETRMWNGGISNIGGRGRGGSVDRGGRGRNGRGGLYSSHYSRGVGFDEPGDGSRNDTQPFQGRTRPFDRSQSERGWSERNGVTDPVEWNGSTSPRKELSRGSSGSTLMEGNWRRHRTAGDDEDGWRGVSNSNWEKWVPRSSWRDGGISDRDRLDRGDNEGDEGRSSGRWEHRGNHRSSHDTVHRTSSHPPRAWDPNHHDNHDNLPEWATENPSESGGSFDASGAFHGGMYSDEDEDGIISAGGTHEHQQQQRARRISEGNSTSTSKNSNKTALPYSNSLNQGQTTTSSSSSSSNRHINSTSVTLNRERPKSLHPFEEKENSVEQDTRRSSSPTKSATVQVPNNTPMKTSSASDVTNKKPDKIINNDKVTAPIVGTQSVQTSKSMTDVHKKEAKEVVVELKKSESTNLSGNGSTANHHHHLHHPQNLLQPDSSKGSSNSSNNNMRQKSEEDLDRMKEEANALVAKLMADEENHREDSNTNVPTSVNNSVPPIATNTREIQEKWFYRDPQGEVQGPFLASEMAEWCKAGYFTSGLMVRRTCDERYTTLGDLMKMCGRVPFIPGPPIPPLKLTEQVIPPVSSTVPTGIPGSALPKTGMDDPLLLLRYQQLRMYQNQLLLRQMKAAAIAKLSQSDQWGSLSPVEQNQLILHCVMENSELPDIPIATSPFVPPIAAQPTNPVMQLFNQMQQAKTQPESHLPPNPHATTSAHSGPIDPIQQLIQQMGGMQNISAMQQPAVTPAPAPAPTQEDNPIKSLLRQLNVNANGHTPTTQMDSVWPQPPPQITPQFNAQNWLAQVGPIPAIPPGQLPNSLWDLHTKEMKTEQQILEEQNIRLQEDRKKEELRKQEELKRQAEEESVKRKKEDQAKQAEEAKRKEEDRKRKEEEKKRKEEEKRKLEEEQKKKEEKKRKDEEKKREEKRKLDEENNRKKQEEERKKREEVKKLEEKQKKDEERRRKLEEEQRKQEEERIKKEEEARRKVEAEEQARRAEQRRREAEALRRLQERSKAPWAQAPHAPAPTAHASLAEIQRLEREKKAEEQRFQQLMQQQLAQQKAAQEAQEAAATDSSKHLQFKWAEKAQPSKPPQVKSLAQIQQEEQERIAKVKQQERERQEKSGQKESAVTLQNVGIWGTASQSLSWASSTSSSNQVAAWTASSTAAGFWDDPTPVKTALSTKQQPAKAAATAAASAPAASKPAAAPVPQNNNKANKSKIKKEEELVKKLFEQNTAKTDDFTQWCNKALSGLQVSVDIPTFVGFLRDIESAYEVKEYVRLYLGDSKQCTEFAKQFLEKRSKWRSAQRPQAQADDLCKPAPAVNPNAPTEFQEVKGKPKKPKKGKMLKVDNRILGFSVTAAPDRINVGDRDYGEGV